MDSNFPTFVAGEFSNSSVTELPYDVEESVSDCESGMTDSSSGNRRISAENTSVIEVPETDTSFELIRRRFVTVVGDTVVVTAVHRRNWSENPSRIQTFRIHAKAMEKKCGGNPNMKFGWYGGDKDTIENILAHGFSYLDLQVNNGAIVFSLAPSVEDWGEGEGEGGLRHVILCQVLLGRSELVEFGSGQVHPSSNEFDSGVDSYDNPKKYVIWSTNMNAHILPEYVVTFKVRSTNSSAKVSKMKSGVSIPTSPWISFPALISILSKFLAREATSLIIKYHKIYKERKLSRGDLIQKVRQIVGDKLLLAVLKSFKGGKEHRCHLVYCTTRIILTSNNLES